VLRGRKAAVCVSMEKIVLRGRKAAVCEPLKEMARLDV